VRQRLDGRADHGLGQDHNGRSDGLQRPASVAALGERLRDWTEWFGPARLVTSAIAVVIVCVGAWFLLRPPPPPTEASLPMATTPAVDTSTPTSIMPGAPVEPGFEPGAVIVHVAGAVASPGVYELDDGSRVDDAVRRAGGPTSAADTAQLNLASPLSDGDRIYVPEVGEALPPPPPSPSGPTDTTPGPVDVNRATAEQLQVLPGVGPATAAAIVTERELNGPFSSFDDLERVPGIGPAKLAALTGLVVT
jgi:competence protein ComEA